MLDKLMCNQEQVRAIAHLAIEAIEAFLSYSTDLFDPIGGETRCEVRAAMVISLYRTLKDDLKFRSVLESYKQKLKDDGDISTPLDFEDDFRFLFLCYVLTVVKNCDDRNRDYTDPKKLILPNISNNSRKQLVKFWQAELSKLTVEFLLREAQRFPISFSRPIEHLVIQDRRGRYQIPSWLTGKILLQHLTVQTNTKIALRVNLINSPTPGDFTCLIFESDQNAVDGFALLPDDQMATDSEIVYAVEACSTRRVRSDEDRKSLKKEIATVGFKSFMLANYSHKPQYAAGDGVTEMGEPLDDEQKAYSLMPGYSLKDANVACVTHVSARLASDVRSSSPSVQRYYLPVLQIL